MFTWLRRIISRTKNFNLLGPVWFSNLDHLVGNIQYLQDDVDKPKQSGIANQSDKPDESKQRVEPSHNCTHHPARTCNCTEHDCIDNDSIGNTSYFGSNRKERNKWGTSAPSPAGTTTTSGTDKKDAPKAPEVPKGKTIVPGFGIVMSMQLINSGYNLQQTQIQENIKLIQEQDYERQQNIFIEFISANDTGDYLIRASANRWRSILRDNPLQRFDLDD